MSLGLGVIGCGSVFAGPYRAMIERLRADGRAHVAAVYDVDDAKRRARQRTTTSTLSCAVPTRSPTRTTSTSFSS